MQRVREKSPFGINVARFRLNTTTPNGLYYCPFKMSDILSNQAWCSAAVRLNTLLPALFSWVYTSLLSCWHYV